MNKIKIAVALLLLSTAANVRAVTIRNEANAEVVVELKCASLLCDDEKHWFGPGRELHIPTGLCACRVELTYPDNSTATVSNVGLTGIHNITIYEQYRGKDAQGKDIIEYHWK